MIEIILTNNAHVFFDLFVGFIFPGFKLFLHNSWSLFVCFRQYIYLFLAEVTRELSNSFVNFFAFFIKQFFNTTMNRLVHFLSPFFCCSGIFFESNSQFFTSCHARHCFYW